MNKYNKATNTPNISHYTLLLHAGTNIGKKKKKTEAPQQTRQYKTLQKKTSIHKHIKVIFGHTHKKNSKN